MLGGCYSGLDTQGGAASLGEAGADAPEGDGFDDGGYGTADDGVDEGTSGDGTADDEVAEGNGTDDGAAEDFEPAPVQLRILLSRHYVNAVRDLLGEEAALVAQAPPDVPISGFDAVGAATVALSDTHIDIFESSARAVAEVAIQDDAIIGRYHTCIPTGATDEACLREFIGNFGRLAFRRSLTQPELDDHTNAALSAMTDAGDFDVGVMNAIATALQSPNFLYQVEIGEPTDTLGIRRLTQNELATRLSFFLVGTTPDAELLDLADAAMLENDAGVQDAALALLARTEARHALADFVTELWRLRKLNALPKDTAVYPGFTQQLADAMGKETLALVEQVAWAEDGDFRDVFDAPYTFVNSQLAALYQLPNPEQYGDTFVQVTLPPEQQRGGIMGHASLLSVLAHPATTSPTRRGLFVRQQLLCQEIPAPPDDVDTAPPIPGESQTMRERLEQHATDPACAGCHNFMDPIGLGLEYYDAVGQFRLAEPNGAVIDANSELDGQPFAGAQELGVALKGHGAAPPCLVRNLFRHATGHVEVPSEGVELTKLDTAFVDSGYRLQELLVELVASPAFRLVGDPL